MAGVFWSGPVNGQQAQQTSSDVGPVAFATCTGDGSDGRATCAAVADSHLDGERRRLPGLLRAYGLDATPPIVLRAFSAGGSLVKRALEHPADRELVQVVTLADATYETEFGKVAEGFAAFAVDALGGRKLFVATASSAPNGAGRPSGAQTLDALRQEVERRAGVTFDEGSTLAGETVNGGRVWSRGGVVLADLGATYTHGQHATQLAARVWSGIVAPWLAGAAAQPAQDGPPTVRSNAPSAPSAPSAAEAVDGAWLPIVMGVGLLAGVAGLALLIQPNRDTRRIRR